MTLLAPVMLWSLVALAPLTAFYWLKVRPRKKRTTAFFLWEQILQENRATMLFRRLRDLLSLVLMAIAVACVCLALAQPEWRELRQDMLIVIDASASMAAHDAQGERLATAKKLAQQIVTGFNGHQRAAVAALGQELTYRSHLTDNPRELLDAIASISAAPEAVGEHALRQLAHTVQQLPDSRRVLLIGDGGAVLPEADASLGGRKLELFKVGVAAENVGLVAADLAFLPDGPRRLGVYFQVASSYSATKHCDLSLTHINDDGTRLLMKVVPLELTPGINPPERFVIEDAPPGRWLAEIDARDALDVDNTAYLIARKPPPVRVAVASDDRFFFENSVLAFANEQDYFSLTTENPEVVIVRGTPPDVPLAVVFQPSGDSPWWSDLGDEVETVAPRLLIEGHPALRHVDATAISYVGARQLIPAAGAQVLVADEQGLPLLYVARHEGRLAIVVNLDPTTSDFYFSAWFPALVHASVTHLAGREAQLMACLQPGGPITQASARSDEPVTLRGPTTSSTTEVTATPETRTVAATSLRLPSRLGFYELVAPAGNTPLAASLLAPEETLLNNKAADTRLPINKGTSPVMWLTVLAIVVLTGESLLYHRRKVG